MVLWDQVVLALRYQVVPWDQVVLALWYQVVLLDQVGLGFGQIQVWVGLVLVYSALPPRSRSPI